MNYLPCKPSEWDAELEKKRTEYAIFCDELLAHPNQSSSSDRATERSDGGDAARIDAELVRTDVSAIDHPLSVDTSSDWHTFFKVRGAKGVRTIVCTYFFLFCQRR